MAANRGGSLPILEHRQAWLASLKNSLPHFSTATDRYRRSGLLQQTSFRNLTAAASSSRIVLPDGWIDVALQTLQSALHGCVTADQLRRTDYFLCSLIHPSYVSNKTMPSAAAQRAGHGAQLQQEMRRTICMPVESLMTGARTIQLLKELSLLHHAAVTTAAEERRRLDAAASVADLLADSTNPVANRGRGLRQAAVPPTLASLDDKLLRDCIQLSRLEPLLLYDRSLFTRSAAQETPDEVLNAAASALCGSIELVAGLDSLLGFLDRVARQQGQSGNTTSSSIA